MGGIEIAGVALALPVSIWVTVRSTRALYSGEVTAAKSRVPDWLEAVLPLKGRWLRHLMLGPVYIPMIAALFVSQLVAGYLFAVWIIKMLPLGR